MGKATIEQDRGSGLWGVTYEYAYGNAETRIAEITAEIASMATDLVAKANEMDAAEIVHKSKIAAQDLLIIDLSLCANTPGCDIKPKEELVKAATIEAIKAGGEFGRIKKEYLTLRATELALIKEKALIENYTRDQQTLDIWCVDTSYMLMVDGFAVTAELFSHKRNGLVLLPKDTVYDCNTHGLMSDTMNLNKPGSAPVVSHAVHYAMRDGVANWTSRYVNGKILSIDRTENTGSIRIVGVGNYPNTFTLNGAVFRYLYCDHEPFEIDDIVVVELTWSGGIATGVIIGFLTNPKSCPLVSGLADPLKPDQLVDNNLNRFYPKDDFSWRQESRLSTITDAIVDKLPGKYSGEMRALVQYSYSIDVTPPYDYGFAKTHGIFTNWKGDKWVIEISSSGIDAWELLTTIPIDPDGALSSLEYIPIIRSKPTNPSDIINVADSSVVSDAYGYAPFFPECGWAFSAGGHLASNVVVEDRNDSPNNPGPSNFYGYTRQYTIDITESDGKPVSASMLLDGEGWLHGPKSGSHLKYPVYAFSTVTTYDWHRGIEIEATLDAQSSPIHCWYDGEELKTVTRERAIGTTTNETHNYSLPLNFCAYEIGDTFGNYSTTSGGKSGFTSPIFDVTDTISLSGAEISTVTEFVPASDGYAELDSPFNLEVSYEGYLTRNNPADTQSGDDVVIIPLNDRESITHYKSDVTVTQEDTVTEDADHRWVNRNGKTVPSSGNFCVDLPDPPDRKYFDEEDIAETGICFLVGSSIYIDEGLVCGPSSIRYMTDSSNPHVSSGTQPGTSSENEIRECKVLVSGVQHDLPTDDNNAAEWNRYLDDVTEIMHVIVADDASGNVDPIYTERPADFVSVIGPTLAGPVEYPYDEVLKVFPSWVGNP